MISFYSTSAYDSSGTASKTPLPSAAALLMVALLVVALSFARPSAAHAQEDADTTRLAPSENTVTLFDGTSLDGWAMAGPGRFVLEDDGSMRSEGGMGLFYYAEQSFRDYELELEWKVESDSANSGVFLRFPEQPDDPWYAVNNGYEVQIDDSAEHAINQTGAIYNQAAPFKAAAKPAGEWNDYRIRVTGQRYEVFLNGEKVNDFFGDRGREGYVGVQNHDPGSTTWFRNIRVTPQPAEAQPAQAHPESLAELFQVEEGRDSIRVLMVTATQGFRHGPAIDTSKAVLSALEETTEFSFDMTEDLADLSRENLARYDLLFLNNATLRTKKSAAADSGASAGAAAAPGEEVWRAYDLTLDTPQGTMQGQLTLYGAPDDLSGQIAFDDQPAPGSLEDVALADSALTFHVTADQYGRIDVAAALTGDALDGTLTLTDQGNMDLALSGTQRSNGPLAAQDGAAPADSVTAEQRAAIENFVQGGGGLVGAHAALDAFYNWDAYREMVGGGLFEEHPWTQSVRVRVEEPENPATAHLGDGFWLRDEIYVLDKNPRWNARVLASLDMSSVGVEQGAADQTRDDYPISWMRPYGDGTVFITKLGHFPDVWTTPAFLEHLLQGMRVAAGRIEADVSGRRVKDVIAEDVWPDDLVPDEKGNVWIAELRGKVHRYDAAADSTRLIAELQTTDPTNIEHGLYGIEIDPAFYEGEPYVYLYYAEPETFINTLVRAPYRDGELDLGSREVLLRVPTEPQCCHQAGDLEWGPDGTLYLSTGDTGMSEARPEWELTEEELQAFMDERDLDDYHWSRLVDSERSAQNLQDLRGKILRINKDGSIPKDNPFFGEPGVRWEIYAYGLRNPYRFKVDGETGAVYIGVVGPDAAYDYDEYNVAAEGGENFGWPRSIGKLFYNELTAEDIPGYVPPMWEYTYQTGGRSASVGPIYRHEGEGGFPAAFQDKVFLYDWARRWIKWADIKELPFESDTSASVKRAPEQMKVPATRYADIKTFDQLTTTTPISMELGPDGALYVAEFDGFWDAGPNARVTRYRWVTGAEPPAGSASARPVPAGDGRTFQFSVSSPAAAEGAALTYRWDFGDGATGTGAQPEHTYAEAGSYTARVIITDAEGVSGEPVEIDVVAGEDARADAPSPASLDERSSGK